MCVCVRVRVLLQSLRLEGLAFGFIPPDNRARVLLFDMVKHPVYESVVMVVIVVNCLLLALDDATVTPDSLRRRVIDNSDYFFAAFFVVEMCMKLVAWGAWGCGHTYVCGWSGVYAM